MQGCVAAQVETDAGAELDAYRARHASESYERTVYVGDGSNDFCPVLRLGPNDIAWVRRHRGLARRILEEGGVRCQVRYWTGAWEAEQLLQLLAVQQQI